MPYTPFPTREGTQAWPVLSGRGEGGRKGAGDTAATPGDASRLPPWRKKSSCRRCGGPWRGKGWGSEAPVFLFPQGAWPRVWGEDGETSQGRMVQCALGDVPSPATSELTCRGAGRLPEPHGAVKRSWVLNRGCLQARAAQEMRPSLYHPTTASSPGPRAAPLGASRPIIGWAFPTGLPPSHRASS